MSTDISIDRIDYIRMHVPNGTGAARDLWISQVQDVALAHRADVAVAMILDATPGMTEDEARLLVDTVRRSVTATDWSDIPETHRADYGSCDDPRDAGACLASSLIYDCWMRYANA